MKDLYYDNKRLIRFYVLFALIFSIVMCCSCIGFAASGDAVAYGGTFGSTFDQAAEWAFGTSISPSYIMGLASALSILKEVGVDILPKLSFGLCDLWAVRILSFIWVALTMLTPVIGEEMEKINTKYVGPFMIFAFEFITIMEHTGGFKVSAAGFGASQVSAVAAGGVLAVIGEFFKIIFMLAVYFFVRYFNYAVSAIVALSTGLSATVSAIYRVVRGMFITVVLFIAENYPYVFYVFYALLILFSVYVFWWANRIITYFKAIYVAPVKRRIFRSKEIIPLVDRKVPAEFKDSKLAIPVYSLYGRVGPSVIVKLRSKLWLICNDDGAFVYRKKFFRRPEVRTKLDGMYLREAGLFKRGFLEISDENRKLARLVMSREYKPHYDEILKLTGYGDYRLVEQKKKDEKLEKKLEKKAKRRATFDTAELY